MNQPSKLLRTFRMSVLLTLVVLALEFILGMYTNLFIAFPDGLVNGNAWKWSMAQSPIISAHVLLGTLLLAASLLDLGLGLALKSKTAMLSSVTGLLMMGLAYFSGSAFLTNVQMGGYSFAMALGFIGALAAYSAAYYLTRPAGQIAS